MNIEDFEEGRGAEVVMMLVDKQQRDRLESHALFDQPMGGKDYVERLLKVIRSMYRKKESSPTDINQVNTKRQVRKKKTTLRRRYHRVFRRFQRLTVSSLAKNYER